LTTDLLRSPGSSDPGRIEIASERIGGVEVRRFQVPPLARSLQRRAQRIANLPRIVRRRWSGEDPRRIEPSPRLLGPASPALARAVRQARDRSDVVVGCVAPYRTIVAPTGRWRPGRAKVVAIPLLHLGTREPHPMVRRALRRCDLVLAATRFEADACVGFGVAPDHVQVIPPGTDLPDDAPASSASARAAVGLPERPTVGFVGRLAAYKGVDTLLDAAPAIWERHPDVTILVAGSPTTWTGYRSAELEAIAGDRLVVRTGFSDAERALLLQACDVVVHPSREESFGLAAIDAWATERPVVLADIGCVRSFVEPGRTAELVEAHDHEALAGVVGDLLDDEPRRRALAAAGRAEVEAGYTWELVLDAWDEALTSLVRPHVAR